jgi:hypothetical protein
VADSSQAKTNMQRTESAILTASPSGRPPRPRAPYTASFTSAPAHTHSAARTRSPTANNGRIRPRDCGAGDMGSPVGGSERQPDRESVTPCAAEAVGLLASRDGFS